MEVTNPPGAPQTEVFVVQRTVTTDNPHRLVTLISEGDRELMSMIPSGLKGLTSRLKGGNVTIANTVKWMNLIELGTDDFENGEADMHTFVEGINTKFMDVKEMARNDSYLLAVAMWSVTNSMNWNWRLNEISAVRVRK